MNPSDDSTSAAPVSPDPSMASSGALMDRMGIEWLELSPERISARVPVEGNTQPYGLFHGGSSAALAETLASVGSWLVDTSKITMGIEIKVNHLKAVSSGWVTGVGVPLRLGKTVHVWEIRMTDDDGEMSAFGICTIAVREPR